MLEFNNSNQENGFDNFNIEPRGTGKIHSIHHFSHRVPQVFCGLHLSGSSQIFALAVSIKRRRKQGAREHGKTAENVETVAR